MPFAHRHLLGLEGISRDELSFLLDTAASFKEISERVNLSRERVRQIENETLKELAEMLDRTGIN